MSAAELGRTRCEVNFSVLLFSYKRREQACVEMPPGGAKSGIV